MAAVAACSEVTSGTGNICRGRVALAAPESLSDAARSSPWYSSLCTLRVVGTASDPSRFYGMARGCCVASHDLAVQHVQAKRIEQSRAHRLS